MHPSIKRANELLEGREEQEARHEAWKEQHADELFAAEVDALLNKSAPIKTRAAGGDGLIYKRNENALQQEPQVTPIFSEAQIEALGMALAKERAVRSQPT
jgi:hypothetical protein